MYRTVPFSFTLTHRQADESLLDAAERKEKKAKGKTNKKDIMNRTYRLVSVTLSCDKRQVRK